MSPNLAIVIYTSVKLDSELIKGNGLCHFPHAQEALDANLIELELRLLEWCMGSLCDTSDNFLLMGIKYFCNSTNALLLNYIYMLHSCTRKHLGTIL